MSGLRAYQPHGKPIKGDVMTIDTQSLLQHPSRVKVKGGIAELRRAAKGYRCSKCHKLIPAGDYYYAIFIGGGGLSSIKFPQRQHVEG